MDSVWAKAGLPAPGMPLGLLEVREWASIIAIVLVLWLLGIILWSATPHQGIRQIPHVSIRHTLLSTIRGESHAQFYQCHIKQRLEKYGMVRVYFTGRWLVYVSDPQYIYDFFYNPDTFDRPNPSSLLTGSPLRYFFGNGILAAYGKVCHIRSGAGLFRPRVVALDQRLLTLEILGIEIFGIDFEHVQTAARQEVLSVIPSSAGFEQLTDETLNQLQYGHAVIKESMRYEPVLSVLTNRHLRHDYHVGTIVLPKGTKMGVHVYGVHHNPQLWDQPDVFKPERFLTEAGRSDRALGWIPFAAGTHQCIGMQFAMRQIRIIFALLLYHYEWSLPVGSIHADQLQTTLGPVTSVRNLFLHFRKRA
ncbi:hypothetical protein H4R34_003189 [Dimargaris verticillata]|uniref:Cytochrome P450 n=1 Tax=Dimargaris verticillata TaxID=2761393 RepID=A0A9W8B161_9FUNG|nr:hypothetical protein H4R34_003189 [Dimargaris verticillata]